MGQRSGGEVLSCSGQKSKWANAVAARCCPAQAKRASEPTRWRQGVVLLSQREQVGQRGGGGALSCSGQKSKWANTVAARCCPAQPKRASRPTWWRRSVVLLRQKEQAGQRVSGWALSCSGKVSKQANIVTASGNEGMSALYIVRLYIARLYVASTSLYAFLKSIIFSYFCKLSSRQPTSLAQQPRPVYNK